MVKVIHCVSGTIDGRQETQTETEQGEYSYYNYPNKWWVPSPLFLRGGGPAVGAEVSTVSKKLVAALSVTGLIGVEGELGGLVTNPEGRLTKE